MYAFLHLHCISIVFLVGHLIKGNGQFVMTEIVFVPVSTGYDSFDELADHSTTNRQPYWFMHLLRPGSTIAICCWPEHQTLLPTSCSGS